MSPMDFAAACQAAGSALQRLADTVGGLFRHRYVVDVNSLKKAPDNLAQAAIRLSGGRRPDAEGSSCRVWKIQSRPSPMVMKAARPETNRRPVELLGPDALQRGLEREAKALGSIEHDNIVGFLGAFADRALGCVLLFPMKDGDLNLLVNLQSRISLEQLTCLGKQIPSALNYLHTEAGFVHNDINDGNILFERCGKGLVKFILSDFGESRKVGSKMNVLNVPAQSPEVSSYWQSVFPGRLDPIARPSVDIWGFASVFFRVMTVTEILDAADWVQRIAHSTVSEEGAESESHNFDNIAHDLTAPMRKRKMAWYGSEYQRVRRMVGHLSGCFNLNPESRPTALELQQRFSA